MDISGLSLKELETLQKNVANEIVKRMQSSKSDALKKARQAAEEMGFSLEELMGSVGRKASKPVAVKYRHPQQPDLTWTGRGKTPKWVEAWKAANGSLDGVMVK